MINEKNGFIRKMLIVTLVLEILFCSIVSLNEEHVLACHSHLCFICTAIVFSQKVVMILIVSFITFQVVLFLIAYFLAYRKELPHNSVTMVHSLFSQKIQMNE